MKYAYIICIFLFVLAIVISLVQMWFSLLDTKSFLKLIITIGAFFVIALIITLVFRDYLSEKEMKDKGYID